MKKTLVKILSMLLSFLMMFQVAQPALAYRDENGAETAAEAAEPVVLVDEEGNETEVDDTWNETYPFGAFAFDTTAADVNEGDDTVITVYRLGGTNGRATAYITYSPLLVPNEDGSAYYGYALSGDDLTIEVEDTLPIAKYQPVGKLPEPEKGEAKVNVTSDDEGYVLTLSVEAESYKWQALYGGRWIDIGDSDKAELPMDAEYIDSGKFDYRCVYTLDGVRYCTDSVFGVAYEKAEDEVLEPMPEDIELNTEPTYSKLNLIDEEDMYSGWIFTMTFAEGEWKKEIHIHANTDEAAECMEGATFMIAYADGGEVCEGSETLLYHVADMNEAGPSTLGFTAELVSADKAEGKAVVIIRREGACERPVTVNYSTLDGKAKAGRDYVAASGTLMFYGNVMELPVTIELIDDQEASDETLDFAVLISDLKGDDKCTLTAESAVVELKNSGTGDASNLASRVYDSEAVDVTAEVKDSDTAANGGSKTATGEQVKVDSSAPEPVELIFLDEDGEELSTQTYEFDASKATLKFTGRGSWKGTIDLAAKDNFAKSGTEGNLYGPGEKTGELGGTNGGGYSDPITLDKGVALAGDDPCSASMKGDISSLGGQYFSSYILSLKCYYAHDTSYLDGFTYKYSWMDPKVVIKVGGSSVFAEPSKSKRDGSGPLNRSWDIYGNDTQESGWANPFYNAYQGSFSGTGKLDVTLQMYHHNSGSHETDTLNADSLVWLQTFTVTRRAFRANAFSVDIATPNDLNTAPDGCAVLPNYSNYFPTVELKSGGATTSNQLYVGSTIVITPGAVAGMQVDTVEVLTSKDNKTWTKFTKFTSSVSGGKYTITLVGTESNPLSVDEIKNSYFRFRVVYIRKGAVTVNLAPSLPRSEDGVQLTGEIGQLFNNYNGDSDHSFGSANITYMQSVYKSDKLDYDKNSTKTVTVGAPKLSDVDESKWVMPSVPQNIQWISFGLPKDDLLLVNGKAYSGDAKIYLTAEDMVGGLNIEYYHTNYQHYVNTMDIAVSWIALYFDGTGDGKISGTYDSASGTFILDKYTNDRFIRFINDGDSINELELQPVDLDGTKYGQYFIMVAYNMTPRCLEPIEGEEDNKAQIMPAITTAVDPSSAAYSALSPFEKSYTYIVSGLTKDGKYTADNHEMYTAKAQMKQILNIPLGGDKNPPELNAAGTAYNWTPNWFENAIFGYKDPDVIKVNNLSGKGVYAVPSGWEFKTGETGRHFYFNDAAAEKQANGFLGSLVGTRTVALVSQVQKADTATILAASDRSGYAVVPDSATVGKFSTSPDASYLKTKEDNSDPKDSQSTMNSGGGESKSGKKSELSEFDMGFKTNLGSNEVGINDYVTIIVNENEVGFAISLPLWGYEKKGGERNGEKKGFTTVNKEAWTQFGDFFSSNLGDDSLQKAMDAKQSGSQDKTTTSSKFSVKLSACAAFIWQYNPLDNDYYFSCWEIGVAGELDFRAQARLTVFPPVYFYLDIKFNIEIKTGLGVIRDSKDGTPIIDARTADKADNAVNIAYYPDDYSGSKFAPEEYTFETNKKAFNIRFDGKIYVQIQTKDGDNWVDADDDSGYVAGVLSSDGKAETQVVFKQQDGMDLSETVRVVITALDPGHSYYEDDEEMTEEEDTVSQTRIIYLAEITGIYDFVHWNGIHIAPQLNFEIGAGIGADLLKLELFVHPSIGAEFVLCEYNENYDPSLPETQVVSGNFMYYPAHVASFQASIGLSVRVVVILFTWELEFVSYNIEYDGDDWDFHWSFLNGMAEDADDTDAGVTVRPPQNKAAVQTVFSPEDNLASELSAQAYDPTDPTVPFQVSGYGNSMDAANLTENIVPGSQYKVIRAGERSFVAYTLSRASAASEDSTMLVLSELGYIKGEGGASAYGLVNPADPESATPYIVLDDDLTGDLDIDLSAEKGAVSGNNTDYTIHAVWTSYATPTTVGTEPEKPTIEKYSCDGAEISADNYKTITAPTAPAEVAEPNADDYYTVSETEPDPADGWTESDGKWYKPAAAYESYEAAKAAFEAARGEYETYLVNKGAYDGEKAKYDAWHDYYAALDSYNTWMQNRVKSAAANTVVKTADWSFTETATADGDSTIYTYTGDAAFSTPAAVTANDDYNFVYMPSAIEDGAAILFVSAAALDDGTALETYSEYQASKGLPIEVQNYLKATRKTMLDTQGTRSALNLALNNGGAWTVSSIDLPEGQTVTNLRLAVIDGEYYAIYTTEQTEYIKSGTDYKDMVTVYRLLLRKATVSGSTVTWGSAYLLRENRDFDKNEGGTDGIYSAGSLKSEYDSPYIANLRFLTANLDDSVLTGAEEETFETQDVTEQTILTFEMNGSTFVIAESSLKKITDEGKGTIYPFFVPPVHENADGTTEVEGSSGKLQVNINTDANGDLYAVYVGSATGTTGNALYLSTYDASVNKWGDGVMLAMHDMNTYEASVREGWDQKRTEAAYLYGGDNFKTTAGKAALAELYGEDAISALANVSAGDVGDGRTFTFSSLQTVQGANGELLAVTMGSMQEMTYAEVNTGTGKTKVLSPVYDENGLVTTVGTYVVSFGQGSAALGKGSLGFAHKEFNADSVLYVTVEAENVGVTAFRGSEHQPITATLTASGQELAKWEITENIISGQKLSLSGYTEPLENRLNDGDVFELTLTEDSSYTGGAQTVTVTVFTVEDKPDLGVSELSITPKKISNDGKTTTLDVSFIAGNNGSVDATDVFAQFTYISGYDADGEPIYKPLDLTESDLTVGPETLLSELTTQDVESDLKNGKLALRSEDHKGGVTANIAQGYGKRITGTIDVPSTIFAADESKHATIRVELFSDASVMTTMEAGVLSAVHGEYYSANNAATEQIEAFTTFTAAKYVVIPLGTTTKLPISAVSSRATKPTLDVTEIENEDGINIGILNFKQSSASEGAVSGVLSITPTSTGTGVIHVTDTDTNTTYSIAFEVTEAEDGIDIYKDNDSFTFYNGDGTEFNESGLSADQSWTFPGSSTWGTTAETKETPLRNNLSIGDKDAYFTFDSVAEAIDLYFEGTVTVNSTNPGFAAANAATIAADGTVTATNATGGSAPTHIELGANPDNKTFTVTIKITSETATFDRLEESYAGGVVPVPSYDGTNPYFIWSRSFPDTGSVQTGNKIPLKVYVVDNNGIASITVNGVQITDPSIEDDAVTSLDPDELLWCYDFGELSANGTYNITAADISGNETSTTLIVDWFMDSPTGDTNKVPVPEYTAAPYKGDEPLGDGIVSDTEGLCFKFSEAEGNTKGENNTHEVYYFDGENFIPVTADENGNFPISANGIYWARTINEDGTWSAEAIDVTQIDKTLPQATITYRASDSSLIWTAGKETKLSANITDVTINGYKVNAETGWNLYGALPIELNGTYALNAKDSAEPANEANASVTVTEIKLNIESCVFASDYAWNQALTNGTVSADLTGLTGGTYVESISDPANNVYKAQYKLALVAGEYDHENAGELEWIDAEPGMSKTWTGLVPGTYTVVVADATDPDNYATSTQTVEERLLTATSTHKDASGSFGGDGEITVTATEGYTGKVEFAIITAPEGFENGEEMNIAIFNAEEGIEWVAYDSWTEGQIHTFTGLNPGSYYVAVRCSFADEADYEELQTLGEALKAAKAELESADAEQVESKTAAYEAAKTAYDAKAAAIAAKTSEAYAAHPEYWECAAVLSESITYSLPGPDIIVGKSAIVSIEEDENGVTVVTLNPELELSESDKETIGGLNQEGDVKLVSGDVTVLVKEGVIPEGFDPSRLIADVSEAKEGMVVEFTDLEGKDRVDALGIVHDGSAYYIVLVPGDYRIAEAKAEFSDIEGLWGEDDIIFTAMRQVFNGTGGGKFSPQKTMTRAMFVTVLWRMAGSPEPTGEAGFEDLKSDWYRKAVSWAQETGIVTGYSKTVFSPDKEITREQMCVILTRFMDWLGWPLARVKDAKEFSDADKIGKWAKDSVEACTQMGLINGIKDKFAPKDGATRMQVSTILARFIRELIAQYC